MKPQINLFQTINRNLEVPISVLKSKNHVNINIIPYGQNIFEAVKIKLNQLCFIYAFDQSDSKLFVQKIWGTAS